MSMKLTKAVRKKASAPTTPAKTLSPDEGKKSKNIRLIKSTRLEKIPNSFHDPITDAVGAEPIHEKSSTLKIL